MFFSQKLKRLRLSGTFLKKKFHVGKWKCLRMSCERKMSVWSTEISANLLLHCNTYLALWRFFPTSRRHWNKDSFIHSLLLESPKNVHPGGHSKGSTGNWQPKEPFYHQGSMILQYTLQCLRFSCSLKNSWFIISAVDYVNDILPFIIYLHPYHTQKRPVRSIVIINIISKVGWVWSSGWT